jgi:hypothetical protein
MQGEGRRALLERAYERFNARDIDRPDVAQEQVLRSKEAIRSYWEGQFAAANPIVTPTGFIEVGDDLVAVVDQVVLNFDGEPLVPLGTVFHRYSFADGLVRRMVVYADRAEAVAGS